MTQIIPETQPKYDVTRIIERPDGCYWVNQETGSEYGPFPTLLAAVQDMEDSDMVSETGADALHEAEDEIGINGWIDPDTGEPAEETHTHIEDH